MGCAIARVVGVPLCRHVWLPLPGPLGRAGETRTQALMPEHTAFPRALTPRPGCGDRGLGRPVAACVPAVSGMTSAVCSVARSAAAATALHALCFSAVKVGERAPRLLPAPVAPPDGPGNQMWPPGRTDTDPPSIRGSRPGGEASAEGGPVFRHLGAQGPPGRASPTGVSLARLVRRQRLCCWNHFFLCSSWLETCCPCK